MKSISEVPVKTKDSINYRDNFAQFLTESERSAYTIKNYLCDLDGFAVWLKSKGNEEFAPELITPTDLREYKHHLDETLQLKPQTINRKLSSLRSFLNWAGIEGYFRDNRLPHVPQPIKEQASAPKWLDRLSQHALCRIVEKGRKPRDIAIIKLLFNFFTLSDKDLTLVKKRSGDHNLLGFALQLGTLRYLSFIPDNFPQLPLQVVEYVAQQLKVSPKAIADYGERSQTRTSQLQEIQDYLGFRKPSKIDYQQLGTWLLERAMEHDRPLLLFQLLIKKLEIAKIIRPGLTILERMVATARNEAWTETALRLQPILTEKCSQFLDSLLEVEEEKQRTPLAWLRTGAVSNSPRAILNASAKLDFLNQQNVPDWDVTVLNPNRLKFLAKLGKKSPTQALSRTPAARRYSILIAFCSQIYTEIIDETIDLYINTLANTYARSKKDRDLFQRRIAQSLNQKIKLLNKIGQVILDEEIQDEELRGKIYDRVTPEELSTAIAECKL